MVIFDDGNTILKTLEFAQPVHWLVHQVERDPDVWNRHWAIEQLVARLPDSVAVAALANAAISSDYFLTRMEAADSLGAAPAGGGAVIAALERATTDTSAQVRAAAVRSLGRVGGDRAARLARRAWTGDTSYEVRAQAVVALAKLDQTGVREAIAQSLGTPSYQNTSTNSAYGAIVQTNDTSFIARVDSAAGTAVEPSYVLAILGMRGSARALDLVVGHLDDDRPAVRRWALEAITSVLPDTVAAAHLTAIKDRLRHEDSKEAVQQAIERLTTQHGPTKP